MNAPWYYSHDNMTHGPFTAEQIKAHAARKMLLESDWIWQGDDNRKDAVPAAAALDFSRLPAVASPIPDWLADVADVATKGPAPGPLPSDELPEWLEDLRLWVGLEMYIQDERGADTTISNPTAAGEIPDWLKTWMPGEKAKPSQPDQAAPAPRAPAIPEAIPGSPPIAETPAAVSQTAQPTLRLPISGTSQLLSPVTLDPPVAPSSIAASSIAPPPVAPPVNSLDAILDASGIDVQTGRVVDVEKFHRWKQQHARAASVPQPVSNASLFETFRKARTAIERWVDDDANRAYVMQADPETIKSRPGIETILQEYANYGKDMREKLLRHLEFIAENRKKYYTAMEERRTGNRLR